MVHGIDDDVVHFITAVVGAPNAVVGGRRRARLAVQGGVAGLRAIAEGAVVAQAVVHGIDDDVVHFITAVVGAPNAVVGGRRRAGLAIQGGVAGLRAIAEGAVIAVGVIGDVDDDVVHFITAVVGAPNAVVGRRRRAGLAVQGGVAGLRAIAEGAVVAQASWFTALTMTSFTSSQLSSVHPMLSSAVGAAPAWQSRAASQVSEPSQKAPLSHRPWFTALTMTSFTSSQLSSVHPMLSSAVGAAPAWQSRAASQVSEPSQKVGRRRAGLAVQGGVAEGALSVGVW